MKTEASLSGQYDSVAIIHDIWVDEGNHPFRRDFYDPALERVIGEVAGLRVLDAACGNGYLSRKLARRGAYSVVGIDGSVEQINIASNPDKSNPPNVIYLVSNLEEILPFPDVAFDFILSSLTLDHILNLENTVREFHRVLTPGGRIVASVMHPFFNIAAVQKLCNEELDTGDIPQSYFAGTAYHLLQMGGFPLQYTSRTIDGYVNPFISQGLRLTHFEEPAWPDRFKDDQHYGRYTNFPRFLITGYSKSRS